MGGVLSTSDSLLRVHEFWLNMKGGDGGGKGERVRWDRGEFSSLCLSEGGGGGGGAEFRVCFLF